MRLKLVGACAAIAATTGCSTTLQSLPLSESGDRVGVGYVLPFTQYAMAVTWALDECPTKPDGAGNVSLPKIAIKVEATPGSADDGNLAFMVDPQELQTLANVTTFTAKWHDGRNVLSSINASAEDRSAQIVGNLVKTAVKLVPLFSGVPTFAAAQPPTCSDAAKGALVAAATAKGMLEKQTEDVKGQTAALARMGEKITAMGPALDDRTKNELSEAMDKLHKARVAQGKAAEALAEALKPISHTQKFFWPEDGNTFSGGPATLSQEIAGKWINHAPPLALPVYFQIERTGSFGQIPAYLNLAGGTNPQSPVVIPARQIKPQKAAGIRYRMPAAGRLVACRQSPCASNNSGGVLAKFEGPVAQLGYVNVLPFRGRPFGNNAFSAEFAPDGSLKSVGYEQKSAPAEAATGALANAAERAAAVLDPTARMQSKTAYLKALKEQSDALEAMKAPDAATLEKTSLDAETALLSARLANLKAEIELANLQAATGP